MNGSDRINGTDLIAKIREEMLLEELDAIIIPSTDPHLGEYVPDHWRVIKWLTGFTGSAANVVITESFAGLWTDSRYFIQAGKQLQGSGFELVKLKIPHTPEYIDWLAEKMPSKCRIGFDASLFPVALFDLLKTRLENKNPSFNKNISFLYKLWTGRPAKPGKKAFEHGVRYAGRTREEKISELRRKMREVNADYHLLTSLDDIAWLLNIRGEDVEYSPLFTAFALAGHDIFWLFSDIDRIPPDLADQLIATGITLCEYDEIKLFLSHLPEDCSLLLTPSTTSFALSDSLPVSVKRINDVSIPTRLKAVRNDTEISHIKKVMVKDGVAITRFFYWLEKAIGTETVTEISAADKLLKFRMEQENCMGPSFATIAGYNEHGALPHYCSTPETDVQLKKEGVFLLDSGGQYLDGTTDITRCIALGEPTEQQKRDFTLALKGTINLAMVKFPEGTRGYQIEILARKSLWDNGLNYGHGTGHGVGFFLNVHEGPQTIGTGASGDLKTYFLPGMLTADEPGIYREGEYGFRTENLILCIENSVTEFGKFLAFEAVTLCYIDTSLIEKELLSDNEREWLNSYHKRVYKMISPHLSDEERSWLENKTREI